MNGWPEVITLSRESSDVKNEDQNQQMGKRGWVETEDAGRGQKLHLIVSEENVKKKKKRENRKNNSLQFIKMVTEITIHDKFWRLMLRKFQECWTLRKKVGRDWRHKKTRNWEQILSGENLSNGIFRKREKRKEVLCDPSVMYLGGPFPFITVGT